MTQKHLSLKTFSRSLVAIAALGLATTACETANGGNVYSGNEVGVPAKTKSGRLLSVEAVVIENENRRIGAASGAIIGGAAGSEIGNGDAEQIAGGVAGAVIGGVAGDAIERRMRRQQGMRYTVELDNGEIVTIVQADASPIANVGDNVRIQYGNKARVLPAY